MIAYNTDVVRAQIQGQIISINFTEGQAVHAGDLLAQIDPRPYQAQIEQFTGKPGSRSGPARQCPGQSHSLQQIGRPGFGHPATGRDPEGASGAAEAAIKSDQALIDAAKVQLSYTRLTSPIDGVAGIRQIDVGNIISPSTPNGLVVVTQLKPISMIFTLPETDLPQNPAATAKSQGAAQVLAYSQDDKLQLDQGVLGLVNNEILQTTGSIQLKANFPNQRTGSGRASSSTRGCSSKQGTTA